MKKVTLLLLLVMVGMAGFAQSVTTGVKYGYMSYEAVLKAMPEYAVAQADMEQLRAQYQAEQERVENEFNKKYEEFLDGQASFPKTILQKRQSELQEMLDKNIAFKRESQQLLAKAQEEALAPLKQRLAEALAAVGQECGYAFILNTDANAALWLNPEDGEDVTGAVTQELRNKE